jgi:hypothetical protein
MAARGARAAAAKPVIGFLSDGSAEVLTEHLEAFRKGLSEPVSTMAGLLRLNIAGHNSSLIDCLA